MKRVIGRMGRGEERGGAKREEIRGRILEAAGRLFQEKGYSKTTMRQIAQKAGLLVGSVYNVFPSKEEVFMEMIDTAYGKALEQYETYVGPDSGLLEAVAFPIALELYSVNSSPRAAELLHEAHGSWMITNAMADRTMAWVLDRLGDRDIEMGPGEARDRVIALLGALGNMISRRHFTGEGDYRKDLRAALEVFSALFGIPVDGIDGVVEGMDRVLRENDIVIGGHRV